MEIAWLWAWLHLLQWEWLKHWAQSLLEMSTCFWLHSVFWDLCWIGNNSVDHSTAFFTQTWQHCALEKPTLCVIARRNRRMLAIFIMQQIPFHTHPLAWFQSITGHTRIHALIQTWQQFSIAASPNKKILRGWRKHTENPHKHGEAVLGDLG